MRKNHIPQVFESAFFFISDFMNEENRNMIHDVRDRPPILKWFLLSLQHVFAMFGATVLVPIIVNSSFMLKF